jgi:fatty-acid desaturase
MSLLADPTETSGATIAPPATSHDIPATTTHPSPLTPESKRRPGKPLQVSDPWMGGLDWGTIIWFSIVHAGCLAAPFFFTWKAVGLFFGLYWLTGGIGICLGYHRLLTHGSFQTYRPVKWLIAFLGGLAGEGSAVIWVANHRKHHAHSDKEGDPHSPRDGGLWSHMLWFMPNFGRKWHSDMGQHYAPDLVKDPVILFLDKTFLVWFFVLGAALWTVGYVFWDSYTAWSFVVWGMFVRMTWVYHVTWAVNSATHMWGYRNYETTDDSKNLWWVGLLGWGEGWHNNHHAYQRMARHGHKWWEVDLTYYAICAMEKCGLAWNVVHKVPAWQKPE